MKVLRGFDYRRGTTVIHKMDPRAKLIFVILFAALTVYFANPFVLLLLFSSSIPFVLVGRISGRWSQSIKGSYFFLILIFIFNFIPVFLSTGSPFAALTSSIAFVLRFITLISLFSVYFLTTSPEDLTQSMVQMKVPYDYALTFNMAMRFIPTLSRESQIIMDAQKSRGLEMEKGNLIQRIRNFIPILIPLIISSFRRAELVADAMESRAFGASKKRSSLYVLTMSRGDYFFIVISVTSFLALIALKLVFHFG